MSDSVYLGMLQAYHGDPRIKDKYMDRIKTHRENNNIVQGTPGSLPDGRGCAVYCTLNKYEHRLYENELGIQRSIAILEDRIFERLPKYEALDFPLEFLSAIPVGADLSNVIPTFVNWLVSHFKNDSNYFKITGKDFERCFGVPFGYIVYQIEELLLTLSWEPRSAADISSTIMGVYSGVGRGVTYSQLKTKLLVLLSGNKKYFPVSEKPWEYDRMDYKTALRFNSNNRVLLPGIYELPRRNSIWEADSDELCLTERESELAEASFSLSDENYDIPGLFSKLSTGTFT